MRFWLLSWKRWWEGVRNKVSRDTIEALANNREQEAKMWAEVADKENRQEDRVYARRLELERRDEAKRLRGEAQMEEAFGWNRGG